MNTENLFSLYNIITILPECILIIALLTILIIDITFQKPDWLSNIALIGCLLATTILLFQFTHNEQLSTSFLGSFQVDGFTIAFRCLITFASAICIPLSTEYIRRSGVAISEFLIFLLTATLGGMFVCAANDLITIFVSLECLSLSCYLLAGYAKRDIRSNEAAMKNLLMGAASSSILVYGFSWLYGLSGGQLQLPEIANGLENQSSYPIGVWVALICILVGIGFKISAVPFHQWTPDVYEGVRFVFIINICVYEFKNQFLTINRLQKLRNSLY
jgi:NADH:ubiquinone oxidoreductase subunit 2 (subunit N)